MSSSKRRLSPEQEARIKALYATSRLTFAEIGKEVGCTGGTARSVAKGLRLVDRRARGEVVNPISREELRKRAEANQVVDELEPPTIDECHALTDATYDSPEGEIQEALSLHDQVRARALQTLLGRMDDYCAHELVDVLRVLS